jgi:transposase
LLPPGLVVDAIELAADRVVILVHAPEAPRPCPGCGEPTNRLDSRYERRLLDLPLHGRVVELHL